MNILIVVVTLFSALINQRPTTNEDTLSLPEAEWKAPPEADITENPFRNDVKAAVAGKKVYMQMCAICHGDKGKGDGIAGTALNPRPVNFTDEGIQSQTDGAIFWKLTVGRPPMAGYKDILTVEQRWQLINFIRTYKK